MARSKTIVCIIGTRPEAIKMAPVVHALQAEPLVRCVVVVTAQHRDLLDQTLGRLAVHVDYDLNLMMEEQSSSSLLARLLPSLDDVLTKEDPEAVLAQGDTATVFGSALCAFHRGIPFGHIEAGLRTNNLEHPFPEEGYRQMVSRIAHWHFAPTEGAADALREEGIADAKIHVTGNTCIDTLLQAVNTYDIPVALTQRMILVTVHRRESFGKPLRAIFSALLEIVSRFPDVYIVYPTHPNPNVKEIAYAMLSRHPQIKLLGPLDYFEFVNQMRLSTLILTDSGGVQEEAPALAKPVLVMRETTERPEAITAGVARLVGTATSNIVDAVTTLLSDPVAYTSMAQGASPYGDGRAAERIHQILCCKF